LDPKLPSKMVGKHLAYGDRLDFLLGLEETLGKPKLSMEAEFKRNVKWNDKYSGPSDSGIEYKRALGKIDKLMAKQKAKEAKLTKDELLALVLYTGPSYAPINDFLRGIANEKKTIPIFNFFKNVGSNSLSSLFRIFKIICIRDNLSNDLPWP